MALWRSQEAISVSSRRERSGRDVNSIGGTGYTGILLFLKILKGGRERHDREGLVSSNSSSWLSSAEGCLWERRLYRVRAVWIQTRFSGLEGALQAAVDIAGSKVDTTSLARDSSYPYMITRGPPTTGVFSPGERVSAQPYLTTLLPCRHLKTDALVPHDA